MAFSPNSLNSSGNSAQLRRRQPLICVTHCCKMACLDVPHRCSGCGEKLHKLKSPAFYLPIPYVNGHKTTFSILVKPTNGSWHDCHEKDADFHVGISPRDAGGVSSYTSDGVIQEHIGWEESLTVFSISNPECEMMWEKCLDQMSREEKWSKYKYDENRYNCFDFALSLLTQVDESVTSFFGDSPKLIPFSINREEMRMKFVRRHVMPQVRMAANYHKLSVQVSHRGVVVMDSPELYGIEG